MSFAVPAVVVLDNVRSLYNTGAFFRTADGCGVERLILCGLTPRPDQGERQRRAIAKTALGAELTVAWEYQADSLVAVESCADHGYHVVAVENFPDAIDLFDWMPRWPLCLVFGHEKNGVAGSLGRRIETCVRIPMLGKKRSLNVATAAGVVLYELVRKRRELKQLELKTATVRPAQLNDLERLARLWFHGWRDAHLAIVPPELTELRTLDNFRDRLHAGLLDTRVLDCSGTAVGFFMLRDDELYQFYVGATVRGSGLAAMLMHDAESALASRGIRLAWLACAVGNDRAARFYEKCGWRRTGTVLNDADTASGPFPVQVWRYEKSLAV